MANLFYFISRINFSIAAATLSSIMILMGLAALFLPNAILTSLKYRSGVLPSLREKGFKKYRKKLMGNITFLVPVVFSCVFCSLRSSLLSILEGKLHQ